MICTVCNEKKKESDFHKAKAKKNGFSSWCKKCNKEYNELRYRTENGVIKTIYFGQIQSSKRREHPKPLYALQELTEWLYLNGFLALYEEWKASGYIKDLKPSIDRINDFEPYSFSNIRLVTWRENRDRQYKDFRENNLPNGGYFGGGHKKVEAINEDGSVFKEFISLSEAKRYFNLKTQGNISSCCRGKKDKTAGYKWRYKIEGAEDVN